MNLSEFLDQCEAKAEKATKGPWRVKPDSEPIGENWLLGSSNIDGKDYRVHLTTVDVRASELEYNDAKYDGEFMASARTDWPLCVKLLRAAIDFENARKGLDPHCTGSLVLRLQSELDAALSEMIY